MLFYNPNNFQDMLNFMTYLYIGTETELDHAKYIAKLSNFRHNYAYQSIRWHIFAIERILGTSPFTPSASIIEHENNMKLPRNDSIIDD